MAGSEINREDMDRMLGLLERIADSLENLVRVQEERERIEKKEKGEGGLDSGQEQPEL